jgi:hypothetical protein
MKRKAIRTIVSTSFAPFVMLAAALGAQAQDATALYPSMAPLEQYLMSDRNAEIALAQSAAPESISKDAKVMVLGRRGYETAVKGGNGFVCLVWRSWAGGIDDPEFWNPKLRAPICFNPPAARYNVPLTIKKTELVLAGRTKAEIFEGIQSALHKKELPRVESGAMCYMMAKQGYLSDRDGHWRPHLMFFVPLSEPSLWGAGSPGSPIIALKATVEDLTVFLVPVGHWSDGTPAPPDKH